MHLHVCVGECVHMCIHRCMYLLVLCRIDLSIRVRRALPCFRFAVFIFPCVRVDAFGCAQVEAGRNGEARGARAPG